MKRSLAATLFAIKSEEQRAQEQPVEKQQRFDWGLLPADVQLHILSNLNVHMLVYFMRTSKYNSTLLNHPMWWVDYHRANFGGLDGDSDPKNDQNYDPHNQCVAAFLFDEAKKPKYPEERQYIYEKLYHYLIAYQERAGKKTWWARAFLGGMLSSGFGIANDRKRSEELLCAALTQGSLRAAITLVEDDIAGNLDDSTTIENLVQRLEEAHRKGIRGAADCLAMVYHYGITREPDPVLMRTWADKATNHEKMLHMEMQDVLNNLDEAASVSAKEEIIKKSLTLLEERERYYPSSSWISYYQGGLYMRRSKMRRFDDSMKNAIKSLKKSVFQGNGSAMLLLARCYTERSNYLFEAEYQKSDYKAKINTLLNQAAQRGIMSNDAGEETREGVTWGNCALAWLNGSILDPDSGSVSECWSFTRLFNQFSSAANTAWLLRTSLCGYADGLEYYKEKGEDLDSGLEMNRERALVSVAMGYIHRFGVWGSRQNLKDVALSENYFKSAEESSPTIFNDFKELADKEHPQLLSPLLRADLERRHQEANALQAKSYKL